MAAYDNLCGHQKSILAKTDWRSCGNRRGSGGAQLQPEQMYGTQLIDLVRSNLVPIQIVPKVLSEPQALPCQALFPVTATLELSCVPNVHSAWNPVLGCFTGRATRDIKEGATLTVDTIEGALLLNEERTEKLAAMGITCRCYACGKGVERERSDERRTDMKRISEKLRNESPTMNPVFGMRLVKVMKQALLEEQLAFTYPLSP